MKLKELLKNTRGLPVRLLEHNSTGRCLSLEADDYCMIQVDKGCEFTVSNDRYSLIMISDGTDIARIHINCLEQLD